MSDVTTTPTLRNLPNNMATRLDTVTCA